MRMISINAALIFTALIECNSNPASSASIKMIKNDPTPSIQLSGPIAPGDASKLQELVDSQKYPTNGQLLLNSKGGSLAEAIKIANIVKATPLTTYINENSHCLSACAIVFMSGTLDTESGEGFVPQRTLHVSGTLGFHAPYLKITGKGFTSLEVKTVYNAAVKSIGRIMTQANISSFDMSLIVEMLSQGADQFFYIDTVDRAGRWRVSLDGYAKNTKLNREALKRGCWNHHRWIRGFSAYSSADIWENTQQRKERQFSTEEYDSYVAAHPELMRGYNKMVMIVDEENSSACAIAVFPSGEDDASLILVSGTETAITRNDATKLISFLKAEHRSRGVTSDWLMPIWKTAPPHTKIRKLGWNIQ